jgi:hypothetical protein
MKTTFWVGVLLEVMKAARAAERGRPVVISYGGGLDSFCMLVEGVRRGERIDRVAFLDVGDPEHKDPGEWPGTYKHLREVVVPFCKKHGITFNWIGTDCYPVRGERSLFAYWKKMGQIPVAQANKRNCSIMAKVERFESWLDDHYPDQEVEVWIGFEAGEESRAEKDPNAGKPRPARAGRARRVNRFPLIEWKLCRCRCVGIVRELGMPVPRKSACMHCPLGSKGDWQTLAREQPKTFAQIEKLERDKTLTKTIWRDSAGRVHHGKKLSIMGFDTEWDPRDAHLPAKDRRIVRIKAPPIGEYIQGTYKKKAQPCTVCGAPERATKAAGSDYLPEDE